MTTRNRRPLDQPQELPAASLRPALDELERLFGELSLWFEPQELPRPVITIQSRGRRNVLGWFCERSWAVAQGEGRGDVHEITISAEDLGRDVFDVTETLLHEMVHLSNCFRAIRDCSSNQYHNRRFRDQAEAVGLLCRQGYRGWAETGLSQEARRRIELLKPDAQAFMLFRLGPDRNGPSDGRPGKPPKLCKWSCGCGSVWAASGRELTAVCTACGQAWRRQARPGV